jgi:hypothetical protein
LRDARRPIVETARGGRETRGNCCGNRVALVEANPTRSFTMRSALSTILISFAITACAADMPGGGPDPGNTNNDGTDDDPGPGGPGPGGGGASAAQVLEMISNTECDQAHACMATFPTDAGVSFADIFGNTPAECYPLNAEYWNAAAVEAAIAGGTITFDQAAADACMAGTVAEPVCSTFWNEGPAIPDACWDAFAGTVQQGGACQIDFECSDGLFCGDAGTCDQDTAGN